MIPIHQPPAGARDLLPLEVAQKCWINDRIQAVFQRWGYQRIVTSTLEWLKTLMAGGAIDPATVIQIQDASGNRLGLRPELTASIARAAATRLASAASSSAASPQRLCYRANIFRNPSAGHHGRQLEFYQAGVELLFVGGLLADAEILLLLADCLERLGIPEWQLLLGETGLTRSLLSPFPKPLRQQVRQCIARLDRVALTELDYPSPQLKERACLLFDLRGNPADVLQLAARLELDSSGQQVVNRLKSLIDLLAESRLTPIPLVLDLSLWQSFDYYTGIVFQAVSRTERQWRILGQGGRYDDLLGIYHPQKQSAPGIGFCLNLEDLHACLLLAVTSDLPQTIPPSDWLVIPQTSQAEAAAFTYAQTLRNSEHLVRVEMELGGRTPEAIREFARRCGIKNLAWVGVDGTPAIEILFADSL